MKVDEFLGIHMLDADCACLSEPIKVGLEIIITKNFLFVIEAIAMNLVSKMLQRPLQTVLAMVSG